MRRFALLLVITLGTPSWAGTDQVVLRGGGVLVGEVLQETGDSVLVDVGSGQIGVALADVARIERGQTPVGTYRRRAAGLAPDDAAGWLALGRWARDQGLEANARTAFENALAADPDHGAAHRALGHVPFEGRWMTREESDLAQGYVRFGGAWVTPEERRAAIDARRAHAEEWRDHALAEARLREAEARARIAEAEADRAEAELRRVEAEAYAPALYAAPAYPFATFPVFRAPHRHGFARRGPHRGHHCGTCLPRSPAASPLARARLLLPSDPPAPPAPPTRRLVMRRHPR